MGFSALISDMERYLILMAHFDIIEFYYFWFDLNDQIITLIASLLFTKLVLVLGFNVLEWFFKTE